MSKTPHTLHPWRHHPVFCVHYAISSLAPVPPHLPGERLRHMGKHQDRPPLHEDKLLAHLPPDSLPNTTTPRPTPHPSQPTQNLPFPAERLDNWQIVHEWFWCLGLPLTPKSSDEHSAFAGLIARLHICSITCGLSVPRPMLALRVARQPDRFRLCSPPRLTSGQLANCPDVSRRTRPRAYRWCGAWWWRAWSRSGAPSCLCISSRSCRLRADVGGARWPWIHRCGKPRRFPRHIAKAACATNE